MKHNIGNEWASNPSQGSEAVEKEYAREAKNYETNMKKWNFQAPKDTARILKDYIPASSKILEAGCGTGLPGMVLYKEGYMNLVGCDISQEMLDIAAEKKVHIRLVKADLLKILPFQDGEFDAATCIATFTHIREGAEFVLREFCRVVKKDGIVMFSHRNDLYNDWKCEKIYRKLEEESIWGKVSQSDWLPYSPGHPDYTDKIKVGYFLYKVV